MEAGVSAPTPLTVASDEHQVRRIGPPLTPAPPGRSRCLREIDPPLSEVVLSGRRPVAGGDACAE